jgi:hypothetical protein
MRFRKVFPGPPMLDLSDEKLLLPEYGNLPRDIRKAFEKIMAKSRQVDSEQGIIAIWNDDEELEDAEVETAIINIRNDAIQQIMSLPSGLLFVLYGSKWIRAGDDKQLYCFPVRDPTEPYQIMLQRELNSSTVNELVERALAQVDDAAV